MTPPTKKSPHERARFDVPSVELLRRLVAAPLPLGLPSLPTERSFHRDIFFDTPDDSLRRRGVRCRFRLGANDRRTLSLAIRDPLDPGSAGEWYDARSAALDAWGALGGESEPARRLRGLVDAALLEPRLQVETERHVRRVPGKWLRRARLEFLYDVCTVRSHSLARSFQELQVRRLRGGSALDRIVAPLQREHGLRPVSSDKRERAQLLVKWLENEATARELSAPRAVVLIVEHGGRIACRAEDGVVRLPLAGGSGEDTCRALAAQLFGAQGEALAGDVELLGTVPPIGPRPMLEVWRATAALGAPEPADGEVIWLPLDEAMARAGSPTLRDGETMAALTVLAKGMAAGNRRNRGTGAVTPPGGVRAGGAVVGTWAPAVIPATPLPAAALDASRADPAHFLNSELSLLEFIARVLALADDPRVPLLERVRYLSIVSGNLDEFYMVRVGGLKTARGEVGEERSEDGLTPQEQLDAIALRVLPLIARQYECLARCLRELAEHGVRVLPWSELDDARRAELRTYFQEEIFPALTPLAMTLSAGHPFPIVPHLTLALAIITRDPGGDAGHFAELDFPRDLPRFVPLAGGHDLVPIEEIIRANLEALYPTSRVDQAYLFRVTRGGDLNVADSKRGKLLAQVEAAAKRRPHNPVVRLEVERAMPAALRELLLQELRRERGADGVLLAAADVHEVDGPLDLTGLRELAALPLPELGWAPFRARSPLAADRPLWTQLREGDVLAHHPYDDFDATVGRFFTEAADDPDVTAIKLTLYRAGERSPIADALLRAAAAGKEVAVFVELTARFDEERNVGWTKRLEEAGAHVVYGLKGLKTHAKVALVIRREGAGRRRYVHIGTGNYNAATARAYTDLSLLSANEALGADLNDLFNELTGSSRPPRNPLRRCLVAPNFLLRGLTERVRREGEHARAGRGGRIRLKLNGLSDGEMIRELYAASQAGVDIALSVRGICTLRPGVPSLSDRIRVVSCLGRFLEHARIVHFANAGDPEYFIGSADWRPRNLRRRVELLAPVEDAGCRVRLSELLDLELDDPTAWELGPDGSYTRRAAGGGPSTQERLIARAERAATEAPSQA
ncbi:MAG: polyphosphate kinase 1 [Gemmatimonadaceae bacterium]